MRLRDGERIMRIQWIVMRYRLEERGWEGSSRRMGVIRTSRGAIRLDQRFVGGSISLGVVVTSLQGTRDISVHGDHRGVGVSPGMVEDVVALFAVFDASEDVFHVVLSENQERLELGVVYMMRRWGRVRSSWIDRCWGDRRRDDMGSSFDECDGLGQHWRRSRWQLC